MTQFLTVHKGDIILGQQKVKLKGVNAGGWLMMEAYFMHAPNSPVHQMKSAFIRTNGLKAWKDMEMAFRKSFISKEDFAQMASLGLNCVRVPFHYLVVEHKPFEHKAPGIAFLDKALRWAKHYNLHVILDLHGAPGCQNHDWHSDSAGKAGFWQRPVYRKRAIALWEFLADRYKDNPVLAGYDLLNEAVIDDTQKLNAYCREAIRAIRKIDKHHIIFVEGNNWATDLSCLDPVEDDNYCLSVHNYEPLNFTFNFVPHMRYPVSRGAGRDTLTQTKGDEWNKARTLKHLEIHHKIARKRNVPILVGEFGINFRGGYFGEEKWLDDTLYCFEKFGFHWTYWTYKSVKNSIQPDGLWSYYDNPPWVNRNGPATGWNTWPQQWPINGAAMARSWKTRAFQKNNNLIKILKNYV